MVSTRAFVARQPRMIAGGALLGVLALALTGCGGDPFGNPFGGARSARAASAPRIADAQMSTIGVNAYLWRATLETLSFMPLAQADSAGGVIVTDWYSNPENTTERVKVSVTILNQDLRADALRVAASREVNQGGAWVAAPVQAATVQRLEDIILTKARDLRRSTLG